MRKCECLFCACTKKEKERPGSYFSLFPVAVEEARSAAKRPCFFAPTHFLIPPWLADAACLLNKPSPHAPSTGKERRLMVTSQSQEGFSLPCLAGLQHASSFCAPFVLRRSSCLLPSLYTQPTTARLPQHLSYPSTTTTTKGPPLVRPFLALHS